MRPIDADAVLEYLNLMYDKQNDSDEPFNCAVLGVINYIKHKAPTIEVPKWIPCSERLPSKDGEYLTTYRWTGRSGTEYEEVWVMDFDHGRFTGEETGIILAWMPLPKPYGEREDE